MNRVLTLSCLACALPLSSLHAEPLTYAGTRSATFVNPVGGKSKGAGTKMLSFGSNYGSELSWSTSRSSFTATDGQPFKLGLVSLYNGSSFNIPSQVTFEVSLAFNQPAGLGKATFDFATEISTSARDSAGPVKVTFDMGGESTYTAPDGTKYTLELIGLTASSTWGGDLRSSLTVSPHCYDSAYVWGKLTHEVPHTPQVPEPSGLLLGAIGLGLFAVRRWRRPAITALS